jgi:hypothetical protein
MGFAGFTVGWVERSDTHAEPIYGAAAYGQRCGKAATSGKPPLPLCRTMASSGIPLPLLAA